MNRMTIIPENGLVMIDGRGFDGLDMTSVASDIHAVQWYGEYGEVEYKTDRQGMKPANSRIDSLDAYGGVVAAWEAAKEAADAPPPPPTPAEKAASVRAERNALIAEADILINKAEDAGRETAALRAYRQALRDLPEQPGFPDAVIWPVVPA